MADPPTANIPQQRYRSCQSWLGRPVLKGLVDYQDSPLATRAAPLKGAARSPFFTRNMITLPTIRGVASNQYVTSWRVERRHSSKGDVIDNGFLEAESIEAGIVLRQIILVVQPITLKAQSPEEAT